MSYLALPKRYGERNGDLSSSQWRIGGRFKKWDTQRYIVRWSILWGNQKKKKHWHIVSWRVDSKSVIPTMTSWLNAWCNWILKRNSIVICHIKSVDVYFVMIFVEYKQIVLSLMITTWSGNQLTCDGIVGGGTLVRSLSHLGYRGAWHRRPMTDIPVKSCDMLFYHT